MEVIEPIASGKGQFHYNDFHSKKLIIGCWRYHWRVWRGLFPQS